MMRNTADKGNDGTKACSSVAPSYKRYISVYNRSTRSNMYLSQLQFIKESLQYKNKLRFIIHM